MGEFPHYNQSFGCLTHRLKSAGLLSNETALTKPFITALTYFKPNGCVSYEFFGSTDGLATQHFSFCLSSNL